MLIQLLEAFGSSAAVHVLISAVEDLGKHLANESLSDAARDTLIDELTLWLNSLKKSQSQS